MSDTSINQNRVTEDDIYMFKKKRFEGIEENLEKLLLLSSKINKRTKYF